MKLRKTVQGWPYRAISRQLTWVGIYVSLSGLKGVDITDISYYECNNYM